MCYGATLHSNSNTIINERQALQTIKGENVMATILGGRFPIITLNNGLTIVNYGSNHSYVFDTDEILGACSDDVCHETELISNHDGMAQVIIDNAGTRVTVDVPSDRLDYWRDAVYKEYPEYQHLNLKMWLDVFINYQISDRIQDDLLMIAEMDIIDIIMVPYPLHNAWSYETRIQKEVAKKMTNGVKEFYNNWEFALFKMKTCKIKDRVTKIIYNDRFSTSEESRENISFLFDIVHKRQKEGLVL